MKFLILLLLFIGTAGSCQNSEEIQEITAQDLDLQFKEITKLAASKNCTEGSQCSYIAYGSKACGGPQGYLVFSSEIDSQKLKDLVDKYTKAEAAYNKQNGIVSDCMFVTPPQTISCVDGECTKMD
ncbi:MAG TPA: hypothetical protein VK833_04230 [Gillisia sp.]|nr:hypothetical protein [Gillisia sp.]